MAIFVIVVTIWKFKIILSSIASFHFGDRFTTKEARGDTLSKVSLSETVDEEENYDDNDDKIDE